MPAMGIYLQAQRDSLLFLHPYDLKRRTAKKTKKNSKLNRKIAELDSAKWSTKKKEQKKIKYQRKKSQNNVKLDKITTSGNWGMRAVGEKPPIFEYSTMYQNEVALRNYLHANGYLNARVKAEVKFKRYKAFVHYEIDEKRPFLITDLKYTAPTKFKTAIEKDRRNAFLREHDNFNIENINKERNRLYRLARNSGYYKFDKQNINFEIDTVTRRKYAKINVNVDADSLSESFDLFRIKNVYFILDGDIDELQKDTVYFQGINFVYNDEKFSQKLIASKIRINEGDLYRFSDAEETQKQLGGIDVFNFVNINFQEVQDHKLNAFIYASSAKKHQLTAEGGVNVNVYANAGKGQGLPGPFMNVSYKKRKVFKGFEVFQASASYALAGQINITEDFKSQEFYTNAALLIPKTLGPSLDWQWFKNQTQSTRINVGYSSIDRVEYQRSSINSYLGYQFIKNKERINFSPFEFSFINASIKDSSFRDELLRLDRSVIENFSNSLISSSSLTYTFDDNDVTRNRRSRFVRFTIESGGTLLNLFSNSKTEIAGFSTFTYLKAQWDYRYKVPISSQGAFAYRVNVGLAKPTGVTASLPYVKHFFIGGLNSNRAWPARRLGPGRYVEGDYTYENEQPGEIVIESSFELRENIIGILDGAVFIDAGNIWTFTESDDVESRKEGSKFEFNDFYQEIAVGTGAGLRLDFSFLILRFDVGVKAWDPARQSFFPKENRFAYNLGIGYPF